MDTVRLTLAGELQHDPEAVLALANQLLDVVAHTRDLAEERVGDGVNERRLSRPRGAGDSEEIEAREVDLGLLFIRGQALYLELNRPQRSPPRRASRTTP